MDIEKKIRLLKDYFAQRPEIAMAFVFGSYAKGAAIRESDFDVAVYFQPQGKALEWETTEAYSQENAVWSDVEKIAELPIDLVVLNRAPATLAFAVLQEGIPIIVKNRGLYLRFFLMISSAAEYLMEFTKDFWAIKQRSASLSEIDKDRLMKTLDFLETELKDYPLFENIRQAEYEADHSLRRNVERWVENIMNASIDIAKILLASEHKRIPETYRKIMEELVCLENFNPETANSLAEFSKLRNILAHEYLDIRYQQIKNFLHKVSPLYRDFLNFVKNFLQ